jgi:hypothetical protein
VESRETGSSSASKRRSRGSQRTRRTSTPKPRERAFDATILREVAKLRKEDQKERSIPQMRETL